MNTLLRPELLITREQFLWVNASPGIDYTRSHGVAQVPDGADKLEIANLGMEANCAAVWFRTQVLAGITVTSVDEDNSGQLRATGTWIDTAKEFVVGELGKSLVLRNTDEILREGVSSYLLRVVSSLAASGYEGDDDLDKILPILPGGATSWQSLRSRFESMR